MFFRQFYLTFSCRSSICDAIREAAANAPKRQIHVTISKKFADDNFLPVDIYGKPEKITADYRGELLVFRFDDDDATLMENASDALLITIHTKLKEKGLVGQNV